MVSTATACTGVLEDVVAAGAAFGATALDLLCRGISVLPIRPGSKRPGYLLLGHPQPYRWRERITTLPDYSDVRDLASGVVEAEVAVALGPVSGGLVAVDFDYEPAPGVFEKIKAVLPACEIGKRGAKGFTLFFRSDDIVNKAKWSKPADRHVIVEVLTRGQYTVVPPSVHPDTGRPYAWLDAEKTLVNVPLADLPTLTLADLARVDTLMVELGYAHDEKPALTIEHGGVTVGLSDNPFKQANDTAMADYDAWVWALPWQVRPVRSGGYIKAVPFWRPNKNGLQPHQRSPSLSFGSLGGIKDNSEGKGYSPIDVVMAALDVSEAEALTWLQGRLGIVVENVGDYFGGLDAGFARKAAGTPGERHPKAREAHPLPSQSTASTGSQGNPVASLIPLAAYKPRKFSFAEARAVGPREWLYGNFLEPGKVAMTFAPGGVGKSALTVIESLAMATGRDLLGFNVPHPLEVLSMNLEDDRDDLNRRFLSAAREYGLPADTVEANLIIDSGFDIPGGVKLATQEGTKVTLNASLLAWLEALIREEGIRVVNIDPWVSAHSVEESNNGGIDLVVKALAGIAHRTRCAVHIVHHARKTQHGIVDEQSFRGAQALADATRSYRFLNRMQPNQAETAGVDSLTAASIVHVSRGKGTNSKPGDGGNWWFKLHSHDLGNGRGNLDGDEIGVVKRWYWPKVLPWDSIDMGKVVDALRMKVFAKSPSNSNWIGRAIMAAAGITERGEAATLIDGLIREGFMCEADYVDAKRQKRPGLCFTAQAIQKFGKPGAMPWGDPTPTVPADDEGGNCAF